MTAIACPPTEVNSETASVTESDSENTSSQDPTCQATGSETFTCSHCGNSYTDTLAQLTHDYKDATCLLPKTCNNCQTTEGSSLVHNYDGVLCSRCEDIRTLYTGFVYLNWYKYATQKFAPLNADGTLNAKAVFEDSYFYIDNLYDYYDEDTFSFIIPEDAVLDAIRRCFVFSDAQFAALKEDYRFTGDEEEDYYQNGIFHIQGNGAGGFTPEYSHAILGSLSRPGELTVYVEYAETDGFRFEKLSYCAMTYTYQGDTAFTVFGHHEYDNRIAAYDRTAVSTLRVKSVTVVDALPTDMVPAIQPEFLFTELSYCHWEGDFWDSATVDLNIRIYADESKPMEILDTNIECCDTFQIDGYTVTCDCGSVVLTENDLDPYFSLYREYTYGIYEKAFA